MRKTTNILVLYLLMFYSSDNMVEVSSKMNEPEKKPEMKQIDLDKITSDFKQTL